MSTNKISKSDNKSSDKGKSRNRRPSALMQAASGLETSVDSSLDAFIAEANATLIDDLDGWGLNTEENQANLAMETAAEEAAKRIAAAEQRAEELERETQSQLKNAQSQVADAEARLAAAEQRAERAEKSAKSAKASLSATAVAKSQAKLRPGSSKDAPKEVEDEITAPMVSSPLSPPEVLPSQSKPGLGLFLGVFAAGGVLAFGATKLMGGASDPPAVQATVQKTVPIKVKQEAKAQAAIDTMPLTPKPAPQAAAPQVVPAKVAPQAAPVPEVKALVVERPEQPQVEPLAETQAPEPLQVKPLPIVNQQVAAEGQIPKAASAKKAKPVSARLRPANAKKKAPTKKKLPRKKMPAKSKPAKKKTPAKKTGGIVDPFA